MNKSRASLFYILSQVSLSNNLHSTQPIQQQIQPS